MLTFKPPIIAHRGASQLAPENTMAAFTKAAQLGIQWLEFDVMLSSDGVPVVFHDDKLDRTSNAWGCLADYPFAYLQSLDAGSWFHPRFASEHIPSLKEVLLFLSSMKMSANIEIKPLPGQEEKAVKQIIALVEQYFPQPHPDILFSSFSLEVLQCLRQQSPYGHLALLLHDWEADWHSLADSLNCISLNINEKKLTAEWASKIKAAGKLLLAYTVNEPKRAKMLYSWGVDAVFSDVPGVLLSSY